MAAPELVFADGSPLAEYVKGLGDPSVRLRTFSVADDEVIDSSSDSEDDTVAGGSGSRDGEKLSGVNDKGFLWACVDTAMMCLAGPWMDTGWRDAESAFAELADGDCADSACRDTAQHCAA